MALSKLTDSNDFHHQCESPHNSRTHDVSAFIKQQQSNYASHVIRMSNKQALKQLMFQHSHKKYIVRKLGPFYCSATIEVKHTKTAVATVHEVLKNGVF